MTGGGTWQAFEVRDYALAATLDSGQAFRWRQSSGYWQGVIGNRWVALRQEGDRIYAQTAEAPRDWGWLTRYLRLDEDLASVLATFPPDPPLLEAVAACRGLRLLRQDPWECLASFILSSTKQIVQIRQIVHALCERYGEPVPTPPGVPPVRAFPSAQALAAVPEAELRECRMGFRARYLREAAARVADGRCDLVAMGRPPLESARALLTTLPGVGRKIADCVLLFSGGHSAAFPVDVWVLRALKELYFAGKRPTPDRLIRFSESHFGPEGGYAQQYLFHYMRWRAGRVAIAGASVES